MAVTNASVSVTSTPTALNAASGSWTRLRVTNGAAVIAFGSSGVAVTTGSTLAASGTAEFLVPPGDVMYAVCATTSTVLVTRVA